MSGTGLSAKKGAAPIASNSPPKFRPLTVVLPIEKIIREETTHL